MGSTIKEKYSLLCPPCEVRIKFKHITMHKDGTITLNKDLVARGKAVLDGNVSYTNEEKAILKKK